jgi:hypothetical protein
MTMITTRTQIHKLEGRYPFNQEELEILIRCHDQIEDNKDTQEDFLLRLALASPFSYYFLPGDELRDRVTWIEDHVLPMGFASQLRAAISADAFVTYANEGEEKALERLLEGVADTGRRGPKEALRVLYELVGDFPSAEELMDLCFRLALACDALTVPNLDKNACLKTVEGVEEAILPLVQSLTCACEGEHDITITRKAFIEWAESDLPMLSSPLFTFVHRLIFHQIPYPKARLPYAKPLLECSSDIFNDSASPLLLSLSMVSSHFNEKVRLPSRNDRV